MIRTRKSERKPRSVRTRLRFETLEERSLLAAAAFTVNLYQDVGGVPGPLLTDDTVQVGEAFFAEIMARELHPLRAGFGGVALDIAWDPNVLQEIDTPFDPSKLITPHLPRVWGGTLDNQAGTIDNLAASALLSSHLGRPIGNLVPERFALLHFRAIQPAADSPFSMRQGRSAISTVPVSSLRDANIYFEPQTITVAAHSNPSQAAPGGSTQVAVVPGVELPVPTTPIIATPSGSSAIPETQPTSDVAPQVASPSTAESDDTAAPSAPPLVESAITTPAGETPVLGLDLTLYQDAGGRPGRPITDDTVHTGDSFFVEIAAQDLREAAQGIGGLSINATWDPKVLQEVDQPFDPRDHTTSLITAKLPVLRSGSLDGLSGRIVDLGGVALRSSGQGQPIGIQGPERFALLHFRAMATADHSPFSVEIGASGFGMVEDGICRPWSVAVESQTISVIGRSAPPQIGISATSGPDPNTIQFTTELASLSRPPAGDLRSDDSAGSETRAERGATVSPLVRPALPDTKQFVEVTNTGLSPLSIYEIQVNAPDVTVIPALTANPADDVVLQPGQSLRFNLRYAPTTPNAQDASTQSFNVPNGLVIQSNAADTPQLEVALVGASTYNADITYDGSVNIADVVTMDNLFGLRAGDAAYHPSIDPNADGIVDLGDFGLLAVHYRLTRPGPQPALLSGAGLPASPSAVTVPRSSLVTQKSSPPIGTALATDAVFGDPLSGTAGPAAVSDELEELIDSIAGGQ